MNDNLGKLHIALAMTVALACHAACSSTTNQAGSPADASSPPSSCGDPSRTGSTPCGTVGLVCAAGSHCITSIPAGCPTGCESDVNCGPKERCVKCSTAANAIGSCHACSDDPAAACAAGDGGTTCERDTFFDKDCVSPGKAFSCPSTTEPTGQGSCAQAELPGIWCCGGAAATCKRDTTVDQSECGHPGPTGLRPPKGYTCGAGTPPTDPKCIQGDLPIHWCCPT